MKKFYPTKLPSKQGLVLVINGLKSTDKSFIANSFCEYFSTVTRNLYQEQICSAEENIPNQVTESQFETLETESDIL